MTEFENPKSKKTDINAEIENMKLSFANSSIEKTIEAIFNTKNADALTSKFDINTNVDPLRISLNNYFALTNNI